MKKKIIQIATRCYKVVKKLNTENSSKIIHTTTPTSLLSPRFLDTIFDGQVDIIVCIHNSPVDVQNCLNSLHYYCDSGYNFIFVDDGSLEETSSIIDSFTKKRLQTTIIRHHTAIGYTKSANAGLRASTAPYIVLLNSDTIVTEDCFKKLVTALRVDSRLGIVGPLSNAATRQSIPEVHKNGTWAINQLPEGVSPSDMNRLLEHHTCKRIVPSLTVNGFCMMIRREVIQAIGVLDDINFPIGYGEENDYCFRAQNAGFECAIVTDAYVFHQKTKSFSTEDRIKLSAMGQQKLLELHGAEKLNLARKILKNNSDLQSIRYIITYFLKQFTNKSFPSVLFLLPSPPDSNGVHSVMQDSLALSQVGVRVRVATKQMDREYFLSHYGPLYDHILLFYTKESYIQYYATMFNIVVATHFRTVNTLKYIINACTNVTPIYYAQNYEPLLQDIDSSSWHQARASYNLVPGITIFAKIDWIKEQIESKHSIKVHSVQTSIDQRIYTQCTKTNSRHITIAARVRFNSQRRIPPALALRVLERVYKELDGQVNIEIFGSSSEEIVKHCTLHQHFKNHGLLKWEEEASLLQRSCIFCDFSTYQDQALGVTAIEAMACGCAVVVPQQGGAKEFAKHEYNSLLVDSLNEKHYDEALKRLILNKDFRVSLVKAGIETAALYSSQKSALSEALFFIAAHNMRRWKC